MHIGGGGVVLMPAEFFFQGTSNLLRWTSKIYKKEGMSITIYNISTGAYPGFAWGRQIFLDL